MQAFDNETTIPADLYDESKLLPRTARARVSREYRETVYSVDAIDRLQEVIEDPNEYAPESGHIAAVELIGDIKIIDCRHEPGGSDYKYIVPVRETRFYVTVSVPETRVKRQIPTFYEWLSKQYDPSRSPDAWASGEYTTADLAADLIHAADAAPPLHGKRWAWVRYAERMTRADMWPRVFSQLQGAYTDYEKATYRVRQLHGVHPWHIEEPSEPAQRRT